MSGTFKNFIAGAWVEPAAGEYFENRNPADWNDLIGRFPNQVWTTLIAQRHQRNGGSGNGRGLRPPRAAKSCNG